MGFVYYCAGLAVFLLGEDRKVIYLAVILTIMEQYILPLTYYLTLFNLT